MIKIAIVDDDMITLNQIKALIEEKIGTEITIDTYSDSAVFHDNNDNWSYDLIFLDIDMPKINGFEIARTISLLKKSIAIVFVSNLEHLVYDSLEFRPFRFVRKSQLAPDILSAVDAFMIEQKRKQDVFVVKTNGMTIPIPVADIVYFESMGHDICIKTSEDKRYQLLRERENHITIKLLTEQFVSKGFIRVHRSYLVNYQYIYVIKASEVVLKNNEKLMINPRNANSIRDKFQRCIIMEGEQK